MGISVNSARIFFIDDDPMAGELWLRFFRATPYDCRVFEDPAEALDQFRMQSAELIITDLRMPGMSGTQLLEEIRTLDSQVPVIIITAYATLDSAIASLRLGATDFIKKPYDMEELRELVARTLDHEQQKGKRSKPPLQFQAEDLHYTMVGESSAMQQVYAMIDKLAHVQCNVIIQGESGTGKELVARAIHNRGPQHSEPFVVIDCGSIADTLLESELFGHRRGAFTGADNERQGLLQAAGTGTVFLDEIGNISDAMQIKLLRVLQEGTFTPVGGNAVVSTRARFIAATNRDLRALVDEGGFRQDLFHRLNIVTINMPPLDQRREDIPTLIDYFSKQFAQKYERPIKTFSPEKMRQLNAHPWKGNIRELRNYVERCFIMSEGVWLDMDDSSDEATIHTNRTQATQPIPTGINKGVGHHDLGQIEARHIQEVLESVGGNQSKAAEILGIHRTTLWRKLRQMENYKDTSDRWKQ